MKNYLLQRIRELEARVQSLEISRAEQAVEIGELKGQIILCKVQSRRPNADEPWPSKVFPTPVMPRMPTIAEETSK